MLMFFVGRITNEIDSEMEKLISNRDLVLEKFEATSKTGGGAVNYVVRWLSDAEEHMIKVEGMLRREEMISVLGIPIYYCLPRFLFNEQNTYRFFCGILERIKTLNAKCEIELFFNSVPDSDYSSPPYNFVCFESQKVASDQILETLKYSTTRVIGLHGNRGSGKTQLVKAVAAKAKYLKIFRKVVFATVSQNPNVQRIQNEISLSCFGYDCYGDKNEEERAKYLSGRLSYGPTLIILDDVPEKFDYQSIGFPTTGESKILFTTWSQREFIWVNHERKIPLHPISEEEGWMFFKKHSGINEEESPSDLLNVAREVFSECEGLPGKIIKVGSSLKSQPIQEWKASLYSLRHSTARYHIFLSFRGEDTRHSFTGFLYRALCREGFKTFMDDGIEGLHGGDLISPALIEAIEASRLSIVVLSENYAHSSWCLSELVKILECMKVKNQLVLPIFYKVEPSDVRYQNNSYGNAMAKHEKRFGTDPEEVQKWKSALFEVSNLPGKTYKTGYEYEYIKKTVDDVNSIKRGLHLQSMDTDEKEVFSFSYNKKIWNHPDYRKLEIVCILDDIVKGPAPLK
ncbi:probable disease resistance protein At1g61310 isoform X2 [Lotus japonicus]|uniref:probable disease resistance protein At1g61310 isoform X2 n=1 Tax=Lotus japonicus TaxID=34305 RepID=UPI002587F7B8|nr:probable disease resistance protein At1g61310 isoform X2 [Lotus japonicus]XP_057441223.1 probable disease resistance protein At1g61310 isoform X2 [Lotus japonicus]